MERAPPNTLSHTHSSLKVETAGSWTHHPGLKKALRPETPEEVQPTLDNNKHNCETLTDLELLFQRHSKTGRGT